jgi:hypothetical protein
MSTQTTWLRTAATIATAVATGSLVAGAAPARASPGPEPADQSVSVHTCPRIDSLARTLRADGFSAPAAKNFAVFIQRDCLDEI